MLNEDGLPQLRISPTYRRLLDKGAAENSDETRAYVKDKFRSALWLIKSVEQRQKTIHKVATSICNFQRDFLDHGIEHLRPLVLRDVANDIGMHESTVSRVVTNKYMHTPQGVFEMKYFFHSGISSSYGDAVSSVTIKNRIKKIIEGEDPKKPLSDSKIVNILQREGLMLARRTIAKYREELKIPTSNQRKVCSNCTRRYVHDSGRDRSRAARRTTRVGRPVDRAAGRRQRPRPPHHQPLHPEDRPRARRLPRIPAGRPHPAVRRERSAVPREPGPGRAPRRRWPSASPPTCRACWSPAARRLPPEVALEGERADVPILRTPVPTAAAIGKLTAMLEDRLAHREIIHGVLIDILGLGVLIVGESGIGKSECALDLVVRGHRLVADDTVEVRRRSESIVIGACPELTRHHMEVRGLGLINIRDLFGVASTRTSKRIELVVQLDRWDTGREYDRLGLDDASYDLIGLKVPLIRMPVAPGRNLAILVEVAARNQLLRMRGINAARELVARLDASLARDAPRLGTRATRTHDEAPDEDRAGGAA